MLMDQLGDHSDPGDRMFTGEMEDGQALDRFWSVTGRFPSKLNVKRKGERKRDIKENPPPAPVFLQHAGWGGHPEHSLSRFHPRGSSPLGWIPHFLGRVSPLWLSSWEQVHGRYIWEFCGSSSAHMHSIIKAENGILEWKSLCLDLWRPCCTVFWFTMSHFRKYKSFWFLLLYKWPFISLFFFQVLAILF